MAGGPAALVAGGVLPIGGGYKLIKRIGSGGFGEVWQAEAPGGFPAAVKIIFRSLDHADAQAELKALDVIKKLRHPFLLQTQSNYQKEDRLFIVMELADGSLRDRLRECVKAGQSGLPADELLGYLRDAAEALDYLHREHVQHRDIKPENILLLQGRAKVADFGLARLQEGTRLGTASGGGTPAYMAPEIWHGRISPHSDQYSLATAYVELRLGRRPFLGEGLANVMEQILHGTPNLDPLPAAEQAVLLKALAKESADRYPTCKAFAQALTEAVEAEGLRRTVVPDGRRTGPPPPPPPPPPVPRSRPWLIGLLATALLVTLGVLVTILLNRSPGVVRLENCVPVGHDTLVDREGRRFYERVRRTVPGEDVAIEFVLVPRTRADDPPTFYIMVNKVSVGLFRRFAERAGLIGWNPPRGDDYPAFHMTVFEAGQFAEWVGGRLPSEAQWDKAAGMYDPGDREGPYRGRWDQQPRPVIAVNWKNVEPPRPMKVGEAIDDVSPFGCRDMAGNGLEWTRPEPDAEGVWWRGQRLTAEAPLRYRDWKQPGFGLVLLQGEDLREKVSQLTIGFRVVLEP
jgi:serine/threonine protein kinase